MVKNLNVQGTPLYHCPEDFWRAGVVGHGCLIKSVARQLWSSVCIANQTQNLLWLHKYSKHLTRTIAGFYGENHYTSLPQIHQCLATQALYISLTSPHQSPTKDLCLQEVSLVTWPAELLSSKALAGKSWGSWTSQLVTTPGIIKQDYETRDAA